MKQIESFQLNPDRKFGVRLFDKNENFFDVLYEQETAVVMDTELSQIEKPKPSIWEMTKTLLLEKEKSFECIISHQIDGEFFAHVKFEDDEKYNFRVSDLMIMFFFDKEFPIMADESLFTIVAVNPVEDKNDLEKQLADALEKEDFEKAKEIQTKLNNLGV